jgi:hypothetical protein
VEQAFEGAQVAIRSTNTLYGTRWMALYRTTDGKQKSAGTFGTRKEAEAAYMAAKAQVLRGTDPSAKVQTVYPAEVGGTVTVSAYADAWIEKHSLSGHARENYRWILNAHLRPALGAMPVSRVDTQTIASWLRGLEKEGKSSSLMAKIKTVASALFQAAAEEGLLPLNPVAESSCSARRSADAKHSPGPSTASCGSRLVIAGICCSTSSSKPGSGGRRRWRSRSRTSPGMFSGLAQY